MQGIGASPARDAAPGAGGRIRSTMRIDAGWEVVLNLWSAGATSNEIARDTAIPRNSVCRIVRQARLEGDARAHSRVVKPELVAGRRAKGLPT